MAKRERVYLPVGFGGLIRYSERERELIRLRPKHVVLFVAILIVIELFLKIFF